jgi:hypothetical protein
MRSAIKTPVRTPSGTYDADIGQMIIQIKRRKGEGIKAF